MNLPRFITAAFAAAFLFIAIAAQVFIVVAAQTPRRPATSRPATQKPAATPAVTPSPTPNADPVSPTVAIVDGTTILASDIEGDVSNAIMRDPDPYLRDYYSDPAKAVNEARQRAVDARVSSMLVAAEAKKRGKTANDLIETEINSKVAAPTEPEIRAAYDANRGQIGSADLESVRADLVNFIRNQRREQLYGALVNRLKMTNVVSKSADVNTPNLAPGTVLVSINGDPLRVDAGLELVRTAHPADVVDDLRDALVEIEPDRVRVSQPRAAKLRDARDRHGGAVNRHALRAELVTA